MSLAVTPDFSSCEAFIAHSDLNSATERIFVVPGVGAVAFESASAPAKKSEAIVYWELAH